MAAELQPVPQFKLPARPTSRTPEQKYWRTFKNPLNIESPTARAITHISQPSFDPRNPSAESFVVTTGARVQIFSIRTRKLQKTISRFDDTAHSSEIRYDGRVLVAGDDTGAIQVFDVQSRAILKTWKEHKQPVWTTKWNPKEATSMMSCSDDGTVRLWDLPSQESLITFRGHEDYVRSGSFMVDHMGHVLVTGSYDQTVRLWDTRASDRAVATFKHVGPVEAVLPIPSTNMVLAAADNQIAVLDVAAGKPLQLIKGHQKTITSLTLASNNTRVVSGGLDGHLKIYETTGWNVVTGFKYAAPVLSVAVLTSSAAQEDKHLAVGMATGIMSIKTRLSGTEKVTERERQKEMEALLAGTIEEHDRKKNKVKGRGWEKRLRGRKSTGEDADIIVHANERRKAKKLKPWEEHLHHTRYSDALDFALAKTEPLTVYTVLNTLRYRSGLRTALEGRDEFTIMPVMRWVIKCIPHPTFTPICVEVAMNIMDLYGGKIVKSEKFALEVKRLHETVMEEIWGTEDSIETMGMLGMALSGRTGG